MDGVGTTSQERYRCRDGDFGRAPERERMILCLTADSNQIPRLKRTIASAGNRTSFLLVLIRYHNRLSYQTSDSLVGYCAYSTSTKMRSRPRQECYPDNIPSAKRYEGATHVRCRCIDVI